MSGTGAAVHHGAVPANAGPHTTCMENSTMAKRPSTSNSTNHHAARAAAKALHGILPKDARADLKRIAKIAFSMGFASGFDAGFESATRTDATLAGTGKPAPTDPQDLLATLVITKRTGRATGGNWVSGTIGGHTFEALVFPEHASDRAFELGDSRISKLCIRERGTKAEAACFDRGWDTKPTTAAAKAIVDLLAAGLAETVFGE